MGSPGTWDGADALNQVNHIAVGRAALDAVRDAANRWVFAEQIEDGLERWGGVRQLWTFASPQARHGVDVTATFERGLASLRAHPVYLSALTPGQDPTEMLAQSARFVGVRLGVSWACTSRSSASADRRPPRG